MIHTSVLSAPAKSALALAIKDFATPGKPANFFLKFGGDQSCSQMLGPQKVFRSGSAGLGQTVRAIIETLWILPVFADLRNSIVTWPNPAIPNLTRNAVCRSNAFGQFTSMKKFFQEFIPIENVVKSDTD